MGIPHNLLLRLPFGWYYKHPLEQMLHRKKSISGIRTHVAAQAIQLTRKQEGWHRSHPSCFLRNLLELSQKIIYLYHTFASHSRQGRSTIRSRYLPPSGPPGCHSGLGCSTSHQLLPVRTRNCTPLPLPSIDTSRRRARTASSPATQTALSARTRTSPEDRSQR